MLHDLEIEFNDFITISIGEKVIIEDSDGKKLSYCNKNSEWFKKDYSWIREWFYVVTIGPSDGSGNSESVSGILDLRITFSGNISG